VDSLSGADNDLADLARKIDAAGLRRLEIVARESERQGNLRVAHYTVRVTGSYQQNLEFVRVLEADPRLVMLDSFRLEPIAGSSALEAAYDLRLVDPVPVGEVAT
jgi:Tfp pilus assembly protein PilO